MICYDPKRYEYHEFYRPVVISSALIILIREHSQERSKGEFVLSSTALGYAYSGAITGFHENARSYHRMPFVKKFTDSSV